MNYKVVLVTPAGRRRYMSLLTRYTKRFGGIAERHELWLNTHDQEDVQWMRELAESDPFFVIREPAWDINGAFSIAPFFRRCVELDTIYIRLDDDIVYLAPDAIEKMIQFRIEHPDLLLVFGNIINNSVVTHVLQRLGKLPIERGIAGYHCMDPIGWGDPKFAEWLHRHFLLVHRGMDGGVERLKFPMWNLMYSKEGRDRTSINFISWFGKTFREFGGIVAPDEEHDLNGPINARIGAQNAICGTAIAAHFAFYVQREYLDQTDLLSLYEQLS